MSQESKIKKALMGIIHPETGKDIVTAGIYRSVEQDGKKATITLDFGRARDPFANSIKKRVIEAVANATGTAMKNIDVEITKGTAAKEDSTSNTAEPQEEINKIGKIIAVASGKGGVGKSTVTANLAASLSEMGYRVGILDADIYGPSQPTMFGVQDYAPIGVKEGGKEYIIPAVSRGIKISSIGFFIDPGDALAWRGPMAVNALKQLIHQTLWEQIDYLLIDLPPGTGDIHLSVLSELKVDGAVIVSTPQQIAVADVRRGIKMFQTPGIGIPVLGIIENMAWFTPAELPENRYYIFGEGGAKALAQNEGVDFLGDIPIIQSLMEGAENGIPAVATNAEVKNYYHSVASKIVDNLKKVVDKP